VFNADDYRITIDEPEDFEVIKVLIENLGIQKSWKEYIDYLLENKDLYEVNSKFSNNEGYIKSITNDFIINK
jgi:spore coat polysaccharide biosynthesis protein SpsF (cytidylyltransferase family)